MTDAHRELITLGMKPVYTDPNTAFCTIGEDIRPCSYLLAVVGAFNMEFTTQA
jgi:hypothetical protein